MTSFAIFDDSVKQGNGYTGTAFRAKYLFSRGDNEVHEASL